MKFNNNSGLVSDQYVELYNLLVNGLQNDVVDEYEEWQIMNELNRLDTISYRIKINNAKSKKERRAIRKRYIGNSPNRRLVYLYRQSPFMILFWDDIRDHTHYYGYNKNTKAMKRSNLQRYQLNYQKRSCIYMH